MSATVGSQGLSKTGATSAAKLSPIVPPKVQFAGLRAANNARDLEAMERELQLIALNVGIDPMSAREAQTLLPLLEASVAIVEEQQAPPSLGSRIADIILGIITLGILPIINALKTDYRDAALSLARTCQRRVLPYRAWPSRLVERPPLRAVANGSVVLGQIARDRPPVSVTKDGLITLQLDHAAASARPQYLAIYEAAQLVAEDRSILAELAPHIRAKLYVHVKEAQALGLSMCADPTTSISAESTELRSGAATLLLALAETAAANGELKQAREITSHYLDQVALEPMRGLRASMLLNLQSRQKALQLVPQEVSSLKRQVAETLPVAPPYEEWFKSSSTLNIRHYMHGEFFDLSPYLHRGFTVTKTDGAFTHLEGTLKDPQGKHSDIAVKILVQKVEGYDTDAQMLNEINNPQFPMIFYTGHSNLGGNISMAMRAAPQQQAGTKFVFHGMCRGQQNTPEFFNRYPDTHFATTQDPMHLWGMNQVIGAMLDTVARRETYEYARGEAGSDGLPYLPNDPRVYQYRDDDRDGRPDGVTDALFNVRHRVRPTVEGAVDFAPSVEPVPLAQIDALPMTNAVAFARTLITYHGEHDGTSPLKMAVGEQLVADGFYTPDANDQTFMRIVPESVGMSTPQYKIQINSRYAHLSEGALAMRLLYEANRFFSQRQGRYNLTDKARGLFLANEWVRYMMDHDSGRDHLFDAFAKTYGWPVTNKEIALLENEYAVGSSVQTFLTVEKRQALANQPIR